MRYCPNCHRINAGRPVICNYCGRTWFSRICNRGHANGPDVTFCGECGSIDLSEPAGPSSGWGLLFRIPAWIILIMFIIALVEEADQILPIILSFSLPIVILSFVYFLSVSIAPGPLKRLITSTNQKLLTLISNSLAWIWNLIKWILLGK